MTTLAAPSSQTANGAGRVYSLISADSHVNEPGDLWTTRLPVRFRDRAPRIERFEEGDAWVVEGAPGPLPFGLSACAGRDASLRRVYVRFEEIRRGGWDPAARIEEINLARIDAEVLYPTPRLSSAIVAQEEPDFHLALVQAYNDWMAEYADHDLTRFRAIPTLPNRGREAALAEIERIGGRASTGGFMIAGFPNGTLVPEPEDDQVFAALAERGLPLHIHVALDLRMPVVPKGQGLPSGTGSHRVSGAAEPLAAMIFSGVFDRVPDLAMVFAEVDCGWVPFVKEQMDDGFLRYRFRYEHMPVLPSEYVRRHAHFTYVNDSYGVNNRHRIGVDRILWSSDYPHGNSNYPDPWYPIGASMANASDEDRQAILAGNAMRLYGFGE